MEIFTEYGLYDLCEWYLVMLSIKLSKTVSLFFVHLSSRARNILCSPRLSTVVPNVLSTHGSSPAMDFDSTIFLDRHDDCVLCAVPSRCISLMHHTTCHNLWLSSEGGNFEAPARFWLWKLQEGQRGLGRQICGFVETSMWWKALARAAWSQTFKWKAWSRQ